MKKTLVAIAALAATGAFAQSSVTLSGVVDAGYSVFSAQNGTAAKVTQSGIGYSNNDTSRFQIKAVEDIGGGLKAGATIESTLMTNPRGNFGDASKPVGAAKTDFDLAGRGQTVDVTKLGDRILTADLTIGAHTINAGNQAIITRSVAVGFQADGSNFIGNLVGNDGNTTTRVPAINYTFNAGKGLNLSAAYMNNTKKNSTAANESETGNGYGLKAEYTNGPLAAGAVMSKQTTNDALTATTLTTTSKLTTQLLTPIGTVGTAAKNVELTMAVLGVSYDFAPVKVYGQYASVENKNTMSTTYASSDKRHAMSLGARYAIGDSYFFAQVSNGKNQITGTNTDRDWKGHSFGYKHALSKRTLAYIGAGKAEFGTSATEKSTFKETAFGLQHAF